MTDEPAPATARTFEVRVANLDCEHDAAAIERGLHDVPGLVALKVYPKSAKVALTYDTARTSDETLKDTLATMGFAPQPGMAMAAMPKPWRNPKVLTSVASGLLLLLGWLSGLAGAPGFVSTGAYLVAIVIGGYYFGREAIEALLFEREVTIMLLMSVAAVVATAMGLPVEGATLVFLYSISEAAEGYTEEKTRGAIKALMDLAPKTALVRRHGREVEIPVEQVVVGDVFLVRPGQSLATDGVVLTGDSSVNQAPVTGESVPVEKGPGDTVLAGTINGEGALEIQATRAFAENTIARIIQMVEEAHERKGRSQRFIERFGARYSPLVLLLGLVIAIVPPLVFGADWSSWIVRATVFIVAAAPCALVISIPITLVAALGTGARNGVLIKGGVYVEELARVRVVALDKTGTITHGRPQVTDVLPVAGRPQLLSPAELLAIAAGVERRSEHPLARAIVAAGDARGVVPVAARDFHALTGAGATAQLDGSTVYVGSPELFAGRLGAALGDATAEITRLQQQGKTVVVVGDERTPWGLIAIRDTIRPTARTTIARLHAAGIRVAMLTGDNELAAQAIAREVGIDEVYAELKPEDKVRIVRELNARYGHVAMVGDGVNDAPALAAATVGVAMGAAGTDVALETADVALMADDLEKLTYALELARRNQAVVRQNLVLSIVVIGALVVGAIAGVFSLPIAVLGHEVSEFLVIGSGLRMLRS